MFVAFGSNFQKMLVTIAALILIFSFFILKMNNDSNEIRNKLRASTAEGILVRDLLPLNGDEVIAVCFAGEYDSRARAISPLKIEGLTNASIIGNVPEYLWDVIVVGKQKIRTERWTYQDMFDGDIPQLCLSPQTARFTKVFPEISESYLFRITGTPL
jgi:hypothetical protein